MGTNYPNEIDTDYPVPSDEAMFQVQTLVGRADSDDPDSLVYKVAHSSGGGGQSGHGSPVGVVTPTAPGGVYTDLDTGNLWAATGSTSADWVGPVGTSVQIGSQADVVLADLATSVPVDNAGHSAACLIAAPPSWMDNAGNITAPGLYTLISAIGQTTPDTTPGLFVEAGPDAVNGPNSWQPIDALPKAEAIFNATVSVGVADLPFSAVWDINSSAADVTGVLSARAAVARLVWS